MFCSIQMSDCRRRRKQKERKEKIKLRACPELFCVMINYVHMFFKYMLIYFLILPSADVTLSNLVLIEMKNVTR